MLSLHEQIAELRKVQAEHGVRFSNGREVMAEMKAEIAMLKPKAPDWLKLLMSGITVVGILMGAQYWMTDEFSKRPRWDQMQEFVRPVQEAQTRTGESVRSIRDSMVEAKTSIEAIQASQAELAEKLEGALTPPLKKRKRN